MTKYDYRLVVRDNLTAVETAVVELEEQGWEIDPRVPSEQSDTLLAILRRLRTSRSGGISVPMRRRISV